MTDNNFTRFGETAPTSGDGPPEYTEEDLLAIKRACKAHRMKGRPELAARIEYKLQVGEEIFLHEISEEFTKPEIAVGTLEDLTIPPYTGPGSSKAVWVEFAKTTTTIEPDVLNELNRADLIELLEARGVIPASD